MICVEQTNNTHILKNTLESGDNGRTDRGGVRLEGTAPCVTIYGQDTTALLKI